jgi:hypothetical protein
LLTGVKPPDALTRAAAIVNGQPDPLVKASEANSAVAPEVDHVLEKAMAQNREQRYATADDMRKALHGAEQASTVVERGEAQTVLFPPPPPTIPTPVTTPTQTTARQDTVAATGETTVVRPRASGRGSRVFPIAIAAGVLLLVVCGVFGFYALQKRNQPLAQIASETPSPIGGPATSTPTPAPQSSVTATPKVETAPKKSPREEAKKTPEQPRPDTRNDEGEGHVGDVRVNPPDVPVPEVPDIDEPNKPRRPGVRVLPGGVMIRNLPDGSQIITLRDGMRVMVTKDGKRQVLNPPRNNRRRATPQPAPSPPPQ